MLCGRSAVCSGVENRDRGMVCWHGMGVVIGREIFSISISNAEDYRL